jgi:hypothetical protein
MASADCLTYGPVSLTGRLVAVVHYDRDDYKGDNAPIRRWVVPVLRLKKPLCTQADDKTGPAEINVREIGFLIPGQWKRLAGRDVTVTGLLYHAVLPHDYRPVMIDAKEPLILAPRY